MSALLDVSFLIAAGFAMRERLHHNIKARVKLRGKNALAGSALPQRQVRLELGDRSVQAVVAGIGSSCGGG